jgi:hypothetical protein
MLCAIHEFALTRFGVQGLPRRALKHLLPHTVDLDIENSIFVLIHQLLQKLDCPMFPADFLAIIEKCALQRDVVFCA